MRGLLHLVFVILAGLALYAGGSTTVHVFKLVGQPFPGLSIVEEGLVNPVGLSSWGGGKAGFRMWDRIIAVDGELVFSKDDIIGRALREPVGTSVVYQVEGLDGSQRFVELPTQVFSASDLVRSHTMHAVLGLIFILIAVLLYALRPGTAEAWSFFLFFASLGVVMVSVVDMTIAWKLPPLFPAVAPFLGIFGFILVGVITRAFSKAGSGRLFAGRPERGEPGFEDEHRPRRELVRRRMVFAVSVGLLISASIASSMLGVGGERVRYAVVDNIFYTWLAVCTLACFWLLGVSYVRGTSPRRKARIRQILWAWPVGGGIPVANLFCGHVLELWPMSQIWNAFLLLVPLSTADAIVRHDLLRLNNTARRLVGGFTVAAAVGVALGFVLWAAVSFLKLNDAPAMVALAAVLFAVAAPVTHRVQSYVEGLLRQTNYDAGRLAASFTAKASTSNHIEDVVSELKAVMQRSVRPSFFEVWRLDAGDDGVPRLMPMLSRHEPITIGAPPPTVASTAQTTSIDDDDNDRAPAYDSDREVLALLERSEPQVCDDEQPAPPVFNTALGEASVVIRLAVGGEPVGILVVGERSDGRPYEGADVAFMGSLAGPLAASLVSTLAFEAVERLNRDLEARVQARTAELATKNDELALLNQRKDELVASVSHDFRSPLAIIRQNVQTVLRDLPSMDAQDLKMFLEAIGRQESRLTSMCTNLLDLARLKQLGAPTGPVDLAMLGRMIIDTFGSRARSQGVELLLTVDAETPPVVAGDGDRLGQVFQNLVDNALKFTPAGGRIHMSIARVGDHVEVVVDDSGVGVPDDAVARLFEPFFQVPRQSHVGQGSGLGLAIVKAVIDAHGGSIAVDSEVDRGTRFVVRLPVAPTETPARQSA